MRILRTRIALIAGFLVVSIIGSQNVYSTSYIAQKIRASTATEKTAIKSVHKDWTFLLYIAANNDLSNFSIKNIRQMMKVGSTESINIVVQLDKLGEPDIERIFIEKNSAILLESKPQTIDNISGTPESLYNFISWGVKKFPSNKLAILLWNHGSGIKDMNFWGRFLITHRNDIYKLNTETGLYELNYQFYKNFNLMKKIEKQYSHKIKNSTTPTEDERAIALNDTFHVYLTNQDLQIVFDRAKNELLDGKKIDIIFMDACFMAMAEVASQIKNSTKILVASEEAEPGTGYNYEYLLSPFLGGTLTQENFAKNAVEAFQKEYSLGFQEFTQSAINLERTSQIEQNISNISEALVELLKSNQNNVIPVIKAIRSDKKITTEFYDPDYIDVCSLYKGLITMVTVLKKPKRGFTPEADYLKILDVIKSLAENGLNQMQNIILKSTYCKALDGAMGLSIYFPQRKVHPSYLLTVFDQNTQWSKFLTAYVQAARDCKNIEAIKIETKNIAPTKPEKTKPDNDKNKSKTTNKSNKPGNKTSNKNNKSKPKTFSR